MNKKQQNSAGLSYMISRTQQNSAARWTELSRTWQDLTAWLVQVAINEQKLGTGSAKRCKKAAENSWIIGDTQQGINRCKMSRTQQNLAGPSYMINRTQQNSAAMWTELSRTWQNLATWLVETTKKSADLRYMISRTQQNSAEGEQNSAELGKILLHY